MRWLQILTIVQWLYKCIIICIIFEVYPIVTINLKSKENIVPNINILRFKIIDVSYFYFLYDLSIKWNITLIISNALFYSGFAGKL
jgi:hypothetical protein